MNPEEPADECLGTVPAFAVPADMREAYLSRRREQWGTLAGWAESGDLKSLAKAIHNIRGSAAMYGFPELGEAAADLDRVLQDDPGAYRRRLDKYAESLAAARL